LLRRNLQYLIDAFTFEKLSRSEHVDSNRQNPREIRKFLVFADLDVLPNGRCLQLQTSAATDTGFDGFSLIAFSERLQ
jgi:hypothetical protein